MEEIPYYVHWDGGILEPFPCRDDAEHEMEAMRSRGISGRLYDDLDDAVYALGQTISGCSDRGKALYAIPKEEFARVHDASPHWTNGWRIDSPVFRKGPVYLLYHHRDGEEEGFFVTIEETDDPNRLRASGHFKFDGLIDLLKSYLTEEGAYRWELERLADVMEEAAGPQLGAPGMLSYVGANRLGRFVESRRKDIYRVLGRKL